MNDNLKTKLAEAKTKIKENLPIIVATISTGVAVGVSIAYALNEMNHNKVHDEIRERAMDTLLQFSPEDRKRLKDEEGASVTYTYGDDDFCIVHCTHDHD